MTIPTVFKQRKTWVIGFLVLIILLLLLVLISAKKFDQSSQENTSSSNLSSKKSELFGSVVSRKNLNGLTLRINQILVCNNRLSVFVSASNDTGTVVNNLNKNDIQLTIDNKKVKSFSFDLSSKKSFALSSSLVIDRSGSMEGKPIDDAKLAAKAYVQSVAMSEKVSLIAFNQAVEVVEPFTNDRARVINAIDGLLAQGDTSIYDALARAVAENEGCSRKAIIVLSDGDDTTSTTATEESVIGTANQQNVPIFSIGIKGEGFNPNPIHSISDKTGGQYLEAPTSEDIAGLYQKFIKQLNNQYILEIELKSDPADEVEHRVKVEALISGSATSSERSINY